MNKLVTVLSFSGRTDGNCAAVANYLQAQYARTILHTVNFEPCGSCNYECLKTDETCPNLDPALVRIMDDICGSELVYFVVPNFCDYPCANYFSFNERSVGYFNMDRQKMERYMNVPKRFVVISNTEGFEAAMQQQTSDKPKILYLKSGKYGKRSTDGDILESDAARQDLADFLAHHGQ